MSKSTRSFARLSNATGIRRFGEQLTWIEEPDIFHIRLAGTLDLEQLSKMIQWQAEWSEAKSNFFIVCDMSQLQSISRDARKFASEQGRAMSRRATTIAFGASFASRVVAEMALRARKVLGLPDLADVVFVATQGEALAEVEKRRNAR